jgi:FkbM family methyltransferase
MPLTAEEKFLISLHLNNCVVYDIGGGYGIFTLFFAKTVGEKGRVITFEPNPDLYNNIVENVKLNGFKNVKVLQIALGRKRSKEILVFSRLSPATGTLHNSLKVAIAEQSEVMVTEVYLDTLDNQILIHDLPKPDFVKIDVQGLELDVLIGMTKTIEKFKPKLLIEVHGGHPKWRLDLKKLFDYLCTKNYSSYHVESSRKVDLKNIALIKPNDHLYCICKH